MIPIFVSELVAESKSRILSEEIGFTPFCCHFRKERELVLEQLWPEKHNGDGQSP
jgi:hypothetical protein